MDRGEEDYLSLSIEAKSDEAKGFCWEVAKRLWLPSKTHPSPTCHFGNATESLVGTLLRSACVDPNAYVFRMMSRDSFKGQAVGYGPFKKVADRLETEGLIEIVKGARETAYKGHATRFRAKPKLIQIAKDNGIELADWAKHFGWLPRPSAIAEPLVLKSSSAMGWKDRKRVKLEGTRIPVDLKKPKAKALAAQVNELNSFFADVEIKPDGSHHAFQRVFNQGDLPGFDWNKGGRLISIGQSYQQMSQADRKAITLDGKSTIEIDIRASQLTILHAKLGLSFDPAVRDPYDHPDIPRDIVKAWVTMTLGHDRYQRCWSKPNKEDYHTSARGSGDLQRDYPIKEVRQAVLDLLPCLKDWDHCPVRWGELQFVESCAVIDAVHRLAMAHSIPALPVHDSIIVPCENEAIAREVLVDTFEHHVGMKPVLTIK